jgi:hypothetical protein
VLRILALVLGKLPVTFASDGAHCTATVLVVQLLAKLPDHRV